MEQAKPLSRAARTDCQVVAEPCYCPFPTCGAGACGCGGGRFVGCAPRASGCAGSISCRPAERAAGPDARGCFACAASSDCKTAWTQLLDGLGALGCRPGAAQVSDFRCDTRPDCVTKCINQVQKCGDIGCGLCGVCDCAGTAPFDICYFSCVNKG